MAPVFGYLNKVRTFLWWNARFVQLTLLSFFTISLAMTHRFPPQRLGMVDRILSAAGADTWQRNVSVARAVQSVLPNGGRILDVGSGVSGVAPFLPSSKYCITSVDLRADVLERLLRFSGGKTLADARFLPFQDHSFDIVVAVDVVEHIRSDTRPLVYQEIRRVSRGRLVVHAPVQSADGYFTGRTDDVWFLEWFRDHFGRDDLNTAEHVSCGEPTLEELLTAFPRAHLAPSQPSRAWRRLLSETLVPFAGLFHGRRIRAASEDAETGPPYHAALLIETPESESRGQGNVAR